MATPITYAIEMNTGKTYTIDADKFVAQTDKKNCYEVIPDDKPVKIYLDVDVKGTVEDGEDLVAEAPRLMEGILKVLEFYFGDKYDRKQIAILECHSPSFVPYGKTEAISKVSFGIIINNIIMLKRHQKTMVGLLNEVARQEMDSEDLHLYFTNGVFDEAPYNGGIQKIRSFGSSKPNERRPKRLLEGGVEQSVITAYIPEGAELIELPEEERKERPDTTAPNSPDNNRYILDKAFEYGLLTPYATPYREWLRVSLIIKNVFDDVELYHQFSKLAGKCYNRESCDDAWDKFQKRENGLGIGTLVRMMKATDTKNQTKFVDKIFQQLREKNVYENSPLRKGTDDRAVALFFHSVFKNKIITVLETTYIYEGIHWVKCDKKFGQIQRFISHDFVNEINAYYNYMVKKYTRIMEKETDEEKRKDIQNTIKGLDAPKSALVGVLLSQKKRQELVKEIVLLSSSSENDLIIFDEKPHLFAFKNCIFDTITQTFIKPDPTDYILKHTGYDYDENYDMSRVEELESILHGIHPDPEVYEYFLTTMATTLTGDRLQYFIILTGKGGNGKGVLMKLLDETIKTYSYTLPSEILTEDIKGGANPAIANLNGCRLARVSEPKKNKQIRFDNVKLLTGENEINARTLYSANTKCILRCLLVLEVNELSGFDETGNAVDRRVRSIPFVTNAVSQEQYDDSPDKTNLTIINTHLDSPEWREKYKQAYFHILLKYLPTFYKLGKDLPPMPKACLAQTQAHLAISDDIHLWVNELLEPDETASPIPLKDLFAIIKNLDTYHDLPKAKKRTYNLTYFTEMMQSNRQMRKYVVDRKERYHSTGTQMSCISLCGWKKRENTDGPTDEDNCNM